MDGLSQRAILILLIFFSGSKPSSSLAIQSELVYTKTDFIGTWTYSDPEFVGYSIKQTTTTTIN